ncbi:MAG: response regulator, partial [Spartobacteria bacterium]
DGAAIFLNYRWQRHLACFRVESAGEGAGCTFTIELATIASALADEANVSQPTLVKRRTYRLLLVEDHPPTLETLARLLRKQGHQVLTAASVEGALAVAAEGGLDLVISDIGLPDGTGIDLMVELSQRYGLRGVAISGYGMDEDIARTRKAGFLAHLVKPIDMERLNRVIEQVAAAA